MKLELVPTAQIEYAIEKMSQPDYGKTVEFFTYEQLEKPAPLSLDSTQVTLPDLRAELARRAQ